MAGFIFDMDGCLLDSIGAWHTVDSRLCKSAGITLSKEERDELSSLTLGEAAEWFHERFGILESGSEVVQVMIGFLLDFYRTEVVANPGVEAFLQAAHDSGAPMCVLSSSPQSFLQAGLSTADLKRFFDDELIISAEDRGWAKRKNDTFQKVCALLGTAPEDTWLFDDSWYAVATAREAGLRTVGVFSANECGTHEELAQHSEMVIDDFTELDPADFL
ncbi:MAG: HAD family phosphatase [Eggerthellaceae bacterium]|nr:HAD family phosphatase [Eggerthellaceae bacterium]